MKKQIVFLAMLLVLAAPCLAQMKIAVLEPDGVGLSEDERWMLSLAQGTLTGDLAKYSGMTIIDRQNLEKIIAEQKRSLSAMTSDEDAVQIGNLANASHVLSGKITKTPSAFMLELAITDVETGVRKASHSPRAVTPAALENLSALKEASADLLKQLGVNLTDKQLAELNGPVAAVQVQAQTALAHGVVAQRHGTEVAALSYYYQAAAFDPSLMEATKRSKVISANISSGNIGADARNDIQWRKDWVARLTEFEEAFHKIVKAKAVDPLYEFFYSTNIKQGKIDYKKETIELSIPVKLRANKDWMNSIAQAANAVFSELNSGLNATGRRGDWGLAKWPQQGVTNAKAKINNNTSIVFELVNDQNKVIGKQTLKLAQLFSLSANNKNDQILKTFIINRGGIFFYNVGKVVDNFNDNVVFNAVKTDEISDNLTIRIASVNEASPENARFQITALSASEWQEVLAEQVSAAKEINAKKRKAK